MTDQPQLVLFDIDGTLIDTGGAGAAAWRWAFDKLHGIPADIGEFTGAGMTDPEVCRRTFAGVIGHEPSSDELARVLHAYMSVLPDMIQGSSGYRVLDGVPELLQRLADDGVLLGITSGALEACAHVKLGRAQLNHFFLVGGYGSDSANRTELTQRAVQRAEQLLDAKPDPSRVYVVGDTPHDVEAAHGAGLVSVGVASGKFDGSQLTDAGAEFVLSSLADPFPGIEAAAA